MARINSHTSAHGDAHGGLVWMTYRNMAKAAALVLGLCAWVWLFSSDENPIPQDPELIDQAAHPVIHDSLDRHVHLIAHDLPAH